MLEILSPFDEKKINSLPLEDETQVIAKVNKALAVFADPSRQLGKDQRVKILEKLVDLVSENRDRLVNDAILEGGKPYQDSLVEVNRGIEGIKIAISELKTQCGREIPMGLTPSSRGRKAFTEHHPKGLVVAVSAFNHPFNLIVHQVIPAVAVGCPVIVKPAATTPLSCKNIVELLIAAGLPEDWCQMVICENDVAEKLVTHPEVAFFSFIGSAKVGWYLRSKLSPGATCALEHGGAAPVILDQSANLKKAIPSLVKGGFYHAGQVCVSVQRVFVHESKKSEFLADFVGAVKELVTGDPLDTKTQVGPLITSREVDRIEDWVKESGAEVLCGGKRISQTLFEPTVLLNPREDAKVSRNEIFGPVVCVYTYSDLDEAISRANSLEYAFQAAIFTENLPNAMKAADELQAMAVMINDHTAFRVDWMPFGGFKTSGLGVGGIAYSMEDMTYEKLTVFNLN